MSSGPYYERQWWKIAEWFPGGLGRVVEVGSRAGFWAQGLLLYCDVGELACIDPWLNRDMLKIWEKRMLPFLTAGKVFPFIARSHEVVEDIEHHSIDLVYIDGAHSQAGQDLEAWWPKVRIGGGVLLHDWNIPSVRIQIRKVVGVGRCEVHDFGPLRRCESAFIRKFDDDPKVGASS